MILFTTFFTSTNKPKFSQIENGNSNGVRLKKFNILSMLILAVLISFTACDTVDFGDVNKNPNSPSDASTASLFTNAAKSVSGYIGSATANCYVQYLSNGQYDEESRYQTLNWSPNGYYAALVDLNKGLREDRSATAQLGGATGEVQNAPVAAPVPAQRERVEADLADDAMILSEPMMEAEATEESFFAPQTSQGLAVNRSVDKLVVARDDGIRLLLERQHDVQAHRAVSSRANVARFHDAAGSSRHDIPFVVSHLPSKSDGLQVGRIVRQGPSRPKHRDFSLAAIG